MNFDLVIFIFSIIILIVIFFTNFEKKERYQPLKYIGDDVYKYQILPSLSLKELNQFALTSNYNVGLVGRYLQTFKNPPTLSNLNNGIYFSEVEIPYPEVIYNKLKEKHPNRPEVLIESQVRNQYKKTKIPTQFSLQKIKDLFQLLGARYQENISIPETKEQEENLSVLIDASNLPVKQVVFPFYDINFQYFDPIEIKNKDYLVKIIKRVPEDAISIQIFIRRGTNQELEERIEKFRVNMNDIINPFIGAIPNPYEGIFGLKKYVRGEDKKTVEGQTYNFEFNKINVLGPNEGYNTLVKYFSKKEGEKEFIINENEEEKE
jgi:hypothetical protein